MTEPILRTSDVAATVAGIVVGAIVLGVIFFVRPTSTPATSPSRAAAARPVSAPATESAAAAKAKVCIIFRQADAAIGVAVNAPGGTADSGAANGKVGAGVVSSAVALTRAVGRVTLPDIARPATDLADAYSAYAISAYSNGKPDPSAVIAATAAMRQACV